MPNVGWLEALVDGIERDGADICGSRLIYPNGKTQHAGVAFNEQGIGYHIFNGLDANDPAVTRKRFMQCVTAACMIMRRELFHALSGFDEGYVNGYEDVDLCLRAGEAGKKILYAPDSSLIHFEETSEGRKSHDEPNSRRYFARWQGKIRCDDNDYYRLEGFRKELMADGRMHIFKVSGEEQAVRKQTLPETETVRQERIAGSSSTSLTEKGMSLKGEGRFGEALEVFSCARNQGDTSVFAHVGECLANLGKFDEAEEAYREALQVRGDDPLAHTGIGVLKLLGQQYSAAAMAFAKALQGNPASSKALCGLGMCRYGQGHKKASYDYFLKALDADQENIAALHELIKTAYDLGEFGDAVTHTRNYLRYHPANLDILFSFAGVLYKCGAYEEACDVMQRLMALSPSYKGGEELMESISAAAGNNEPLTKPDKAGTPSADLTAGLIEQGRLHKAAARYDEAFDSFRKAREMGDASVLADMGDCKAYLGNLDDARGYYEEGVRNDPLDARALVGSGVVFLYQDKLKDADICFAGALRAAPENAKALCGMAMVRNKQGKESEAYLLLNQALEREPENLTALFELVKCAYRLKRYEGAERHLRNYLRFHPADLKMLFSLAGVLFRMNRGSEALEQLDTILLFDPVFEGAWEMRQMIGNELQAAV
jgi:tetratricopeptide (TPR) repeat protein